MKLYEINAEILRLTDAIEFDEETGEILGDADELFTQIHIWICFPLCQMPHHIQCVLRLQMIGNHFAIHTDIDQIEWVKTILVFNIDMFIYIL